MLIEKIFLWLNANGVIVGIITFLLGSIFGHRLSIFRDDRNRRIKIYDEVRSFITSANGPVHISLADRDRILSACPRLHRRSMVEALNKCEQAAKAYAPQAAGLGHMQPTLNSRAAMSAAAAQLLRELRRF